MLVLGVVVIFELGLWLRVRVRVRVLREVGSGVLEGVRDVGSIGVRSILGVGMGARIVRGW